MSDDHDHIEKSAVVELVSTDCVNAVFFSGEGWRHSELDSGLHDHIIESPKLCLPLIYIYET